MGKKDCHVKRIAGEDDESGGVGEGEMRNWV
jgi:hypothetical protein